MYIEVRNTLLEMICKLKQKNKEGECNKVKLSIKYMWKLKKKKKSQPEKAESWDKTILEKIMADNFPYHLEDIVS